MTWTTRRNDRKDEVPGYGLGPHLWYDLSTRRTEENTMTTDMRKVTRDDNPNEILGWVWDAGCTHPDCKAAAKDGRPVHALPSGKLADGTVTAYHFATMEEGEAMVRRVMTDVRGLRMDMDVPTRIAYMNGEI
jgi:hypothetical protein